MTRSTRLVLLALTLPLAMGACKKKQPAVVPPTPVTNPGGDSPTVAPPTTVAPTVDSAAIKAGWAATVRATVSEMIHFDYDSDELTSEARAILDAKLAVMNVNPSLSIRISGHCDERGTDEYNLVLGRRRAEQAKRYLTDRGISASRIETFSFGRERPLASGSGESAWSQNRRDEFDITAGGDNLHIP